MLQNPTTPTVRPTARPAAPAALRHRLRLEPLEDRTVPAFGDLLLTLDNPDPAPSDQLGYSVAAAGDLAVVGTFSEFGESVHVFDLTSGAEIVALVDGSPDEPEAFGFAVAVSGNTVVVGSPFANDGDGRVYVFDITDPQNVTSTTIDNPENDPNEPNNNDRFGWSVAVAGGTILVGAPFDDVYDATADTYLSSAGTAYGFDAAGGLQFTLTAPTAFEWDQFGFSVAAADGRAVVGSEQSSFNPGDAAAHVYELADLESPIELVIPDTERVLEPSVAIAGDRVVVGGRFSGSAPRLLVGTAAAPTGPLVAHLFDADSGSLVATLNKPGQQGDGTNRTSVAISTDRVVVGEPGLNFEVRTPSAAYVYGAAGGAFIGAITDPGDNPDDRFGFSVALTGDTAVVGAPRYSTRPEFEGDRVGIAYVFDVNAPPVARDDAAVVDEDGAVVVDVLANDDTGPDAGEALTITAVTAPASGTAVIDDGGTPGDPADDRIVYTPAPDVNGTDTFTYTVSDGSGNSATATVTVTVNPVNDDPTVQNDLAAVAEDGGPVVIGVLRNDSTAPDAGETLTVTAVSAPTSGTAVANGDGTVTYTPAADFSGVDAFTYTVSDGNGGTATGTVVVAVTPVNDDPTANDDAFTVVAGTGANGLAVLANDSTAPDSGEVLTITAATQPAEGGTVAVINNGTGLTFTPADGFTGETTFTYTVSDGRGGTAAAAVTVTVAAAGGGTPPVEPAPGRPLVVSGLPDGTAQVYTTGPEGRFAPNPSALLRPFGAIPANVRTAVADVDGDRVADTVLVTGPGTPIRVAVISGADNSTVLIASFDPFGGNFTGGGSVAAADLDGDGRAEFVVTPDQGGGPRVSVFSLNADGTRAVRANFFGIDDAAFRGGARAALGDVNKDGTTDVLVSAGFGGGPRTAIFTGQSVLAGAPARLVGDFFAFPGTDAVNLRNGSFVAAGDVTGDGFADLIFGGGPGGAPRVFILSGALVSAGDVAGAQAAPVGNFFVAGNTSDRGGVRVAATDADGDDRADVAVGSGEGSPARVRVYRGADFAGGGEPAALQTFDLFGGAVLADGVFVG